MCGGIRQTEAGHTWEWWSFLAVSGSGAGDRSICKAAYVQNAYCLEHWGWVGTNGWHALYLPSNYIYLTSRMRWWHPGKWGHQFLGIAPMWSFLRIPPWWPVNTKVLLPWWWHFCMVYKMPDLWPYSGRVMRSRRLPQTVFDCFQDYSSSECRHWWITLSMMWLSSRVHGPPLAKEHHNCRERTSAVEFHLTLDHIWNSTWTCFAASVIQCTF